MGNRNEGSKDIPVIRFRTDDSDITLTFSEEENAGVKAVIFDILTEVYKERRQQDFPYAKTG